MPKENPVGGFVYNIEEKFSTGTSFTPRVFMVWGLAPQNLEDCAFADLECQGKQDFPPVIKMEKAVNQLELQVQNRAFKLANPCI